MAGESSSNGSQASSQATTSTGPAASSTQSASSSTTPTSSTNQSATQPNTTSSSTHPSTSSSSSSSNTGTSQTSSSVSPSASSQSSVHSTTSAPSSGVPSQSTKSVTVPTGPAIASPATTASPTSSGSIVLSTNSNGLVVTSTSLLTSTPSASAPVSPSSTGSDTDKGFFQNTGAVAGTFTAVGLVALALLIFLVTYIIRRRRQAKFDREVNEATLEAANTSAPPFLDTNDGYDGPGGVYSDASSHGTYAQPPMSTETYGMREIGPGVAGVGVGMTPGYGHGYDYDQYPPAAAYARPQQAQVYADYAQAQAYPQDPAYYNVNSSLNLNSMSNPHAADVGYAYHDPPSQSHGQSTSQEGQVYYRPQASSPEHQLLEAAGLDPSLPTGRMQRGMSLNHNYSRDHENEDDAYGGYTGLAHAGEHEHAGDDRGSYYEEVEPPRVLKIANA